VNTGFACQLWLYSKCVCKNLSINCRLHQKAAQPVAIVLFFLRLTSGTCMFFINTWRSYKVLCALFKELWTHRLPRIRIWIYSLVFHAVISFCVKAHVHISNWTPLNVLISAITVYGFFVVYNTAPIRYVHAIYW
jgi:hypothetical protein